MRRGSDLVEPCSADDVDADPAKAIINGLVHVGVRTIRAKGMFIAPSEHVPRATEPL